MKQALETRHYNDVAGGFIINPGSFSVLAAGAVVCGAASEFARPDRSGAGRAWSAALAGETHTPVIGVDDVWGAALVGIGGDEADGLIEDGKQVPVKACQPGARDSVCPAGRRYTGPVQCLIGVYVADACQYRLVEEQRLDGGPPACGPFHEYLAGERGIDGVGPESAGQFVLGIGENGAGPTAHVVEFDAPPVIEREGVTRCTAAARRPAPV